jgi:hypothetical protein
VYTHKPVVAGVKLTAAGAGTGGLARTGLQAASVVVAAATLIMLGVVLLHLIPRREA